jgi:hypothetical protein
MSNLKPLAALLLLMMALFVACSPMQAEPGAGEPAATDVPVVETPQTGGAADPIVAAAIAHLAAELGIAESDIELLSAEMTEFNDSCLGLGRPDESCLQAITPGWIVRLQAGGEEYELRTDESGANVRLATVTLEGGSPPDAAMAAAIAQLAAELGLGEADVELVSVEAAEFSDSCLGLGGPEESCLQAITPGWRIMLRAAGQEYEVRAGQTGEQVRVAGDMLEGGSPPDAAMAAAVAHLAAELGLGEADVELVSVEAAEFSDSCLGLGGPEESCLQAITPGWLIMLRAAGQEYEARADQNGEQVRLATAQE